MIEWIDRVNRPAIGRRLLAIVLAATVAASGMAGLDPVLRGRINLDVYYCGLASILIFAGFSLAVFLALAPIHPLRRVMIVYAISAICACTWVAGFNAVGGLGGFPLLVFLKPTLWILPIIYGVALPGVLLRLFRGWSLQSISRPFPSLAATAGQNLTARVREAVYWSAGLAVSLISLGCLGRYGNVADWISRAQISGTFLSIAGFIFLALSYPLLRVRRYVLWSIVCVIVVSGIVAPATAAILLVANSPAPPRWTFFFWSTEFVLCEVVFVTWVLMQTTTTVGIRLMGYSLQTAGRTAGTPTSRSETSSKPHPLD